ncbi:hypothetical protein Tco_1079686 [Tanacetum coccineum]|uniref:Uncharacterized protein n=1 Tax=Tanacetum coccineum TaxID=301880 RepID=A0ABQ5HSK1_9ASTR
MGLARVVCGCVAVRGWGVGSLNNTFGWLSEWVVGTCVESGYVQWMYCIVRRWGVVVRWCGCFVVNLERVVVWVMVGFGWWSSGVGGIWVLLLGVRRGSVVVVVSGVVRVVWLAWEGFSFERWGLVCADVSGFGLCWIVMVVMDLEGLCDVFSGSGCLWGYRVVVGVLGGVLALGCGERSGPALCGVMLLCGVGVLVGDGGVWGGVFGGGGGWGVEVECFSGCVCVSVVDGLRGALVVDRVEGCGYVVLYYRWWWVGGVGVLFEMFVGGVGKVGACRVCSMAGLYVVELVWCNAVAVEPGVCGVEIWGVARSVFKLWDCCYGWWVVGVVVVVKTRLRPEFGFVLWVVGSGFGVVFVVDVGLDVLLCVDVRGSVVLDVIVQAELVEGVLFVCGVLGGFVLLGTSVWARISGGTWRLVSWWGVESDCECVLLVLSSL